MTEAERRINSEFDLIVWGATGSTGRRVAANLEARTRGSGLRWAIGGRNRSKLEEVASGIGRDEIPIVLADSHDRTSLLDMVARAGVVCSTVGPYARFGTELLAACATTGTHYCDLAAEAHWIRGMIDEYQSVAERSGARIVHACGMDSIPSDIGVHQIQRAAMTRWGMPSSLVKMRVTHLRGGFTGGTAGAFMYGMEHRDDPSLAGTMTDPYSLMPAGDRNGPEPPDDMRSTDVTFDHDVDAWTKPFFMGPMNAKIVRRSNALQGFPYGRDFRYNEATVVGGGPSGWLEAKAGALAYVAFLNAAAFAPARRLLAEFVLPKPGEGPSEEVRSQGHWEIVLIARSESDELLRLVVRGTGDPGTESTSRMLVEASLCLVEDASLLQVGGGSWTPASAMADPLFTRLTTHAGLTFELDGVPLAPQVTADVRA